MLPPAVAPVLFYAGRGLSIELAACGRRRQQSAARSAAAFGMSYKGCMKRAFRRQEAASEAIAASYFG